MLTIDSLKNWGADVQEALVRCLNNEAFYLRLVGKALEDPSFSRLPEAVHAGDLTKAFEAAHALKGVLSNLALTPLLKRLESKGYVSRRRDPDDERNILIRPTDKGRTLKNEVSAVREHANDVLGLSGSEMETLRSIILKALDNIERNRKNGSN